MALRPAASLRHVGSMGAVSARAPSDCRIATSASVINPAITCSTYSRRCKRLELARRAERRLDHAPHRVLVVRRRADGREHAGEHPK